MPIFPKGYNGDALLELQLWVGDEPDNGCLARRVPSAEIDPEKVDLLATRSSNYLPIVCPRIALRLESEHEKHGHKIIHVLESNVARDSAANDPDDLWYVRSPHFVRSNGSYLIGPQPAAVLEEALQSDAFMVTLELQIKEVFDLILEEWESEDGTTNLATASADGPFVRAIMPPEQIGSKRRTKFTVSYKEVSFVVSTATCTVTDGPELKAAPGVSEGQAGVLPTVALTMRLDFGRMHSRVLRKLMAAQWSSQSDTQQGGAKDTAPNDAIGRLTALARYLAFRLKPARGEAMLERIFEQHKEKQSPADLVDAVRLSVDRHLIAANHWAQRRETVEDDELYQARMSNFFGALLAKTPLASPVIILRSLTAKNEPTLGLPQTFKVQTVLAAGVGHCSEHANVSHAVLRKLVDLDNGVLFNSFRVSNANIDHAFCLVNYFPGELLLAAVRNPLGPHPLASVIRVVDLRRDLQIRRDNRDALVLDAYLSPSAAPSTAPALLRSLQRKKNSSLNTHYVQVHEIHQGSILPLVVPVRDATHEALRNI
jgi:hypothetical protein